jgi:hypothetical protein
MAEFLPVEKILPFLCINEWQEFLPAEVAKRIKLYHFILGRCAHYRIDRRADGTPVNYRPLSLEEFERDFISGRLSREVIETKIDINYWERISLLMKRSLYEYEPPGAIVVRYAHSKWITQWREGGLCFQNVRNPDCDKTVKTLDRGAKFTLEFDYEMGDRRLILYVRCFYSLDLFSVHFPV